MKILIFGCGAIGSAFGGFLSRTNHEIVLYGRPGYLNRFRKDGLQIEGILGRHRFSRFRVITRASELKKEGKTFDLVLLTVKGFDTENAARELGNIVSGKALILSLQNGLGNVEILHKYFPPNRILAGRVIFGVETLKKGIKITVWGGDVLLGETAQKKVTPRIRLLAKLFTTAGLCSKPVRDIRVHIWGKVIYNSALNPLASLLNVHYGALTLNSDTKFLMCQIIRECYAVAKKFRISLNPKTSKEYEKLFFKRLVPATFDHHPSMLADLKRGHRTEINFLNGAISRLGRRGKVPTPVNDLLTNLIKEKETKYV